MFVLANSPPPQSLTAVNYFIKDSAVDFLQRMESVVSDLRLTLTLFARMFALCAVLAVAVAAIDAWSHIEIAGELIKTFSAIMLSCVTGITGLFAGQKIESRKHQQHD